MTHGCARRHLENHCSHKCVAEEAISIISARRRHKTSVCSPTWFWRGAVNYWPIREENVGEVRAGRCFIDKAKGGGRTNRQCKQGGLKTSISRYVTRPQFEAPLCWHSFGSCVWTYLLMDSKTELTSFCFGTNPVPRIKTIEGSNYVIKSRVEIESKLFLNNVVN